MSQLDRYTEEGRQALLASREEALQLRHRVIGPEHLALGILKVADPIIECTLLRLQVDAVRLGRLQGPVGVAAHRLDLGEPVQARAQQRIALFRGLRFQPAGHAGDRVGVDLRGIAVERQVGQQRLQAWMLDRRRRLLTK